MKTISAREKAHSFLSGKFETFCVMFIFYSLSCPFSWRVPRILKHVFFSGCNSLIHIIIIIIIILDMQ